MSKHAVVATVICVGLIAGFVRATAGSAPAVAGEHAFGNKIVAIVCRGPVSVTESTGMYLEHVQVRQLGGVSFVVGKVPKVGEVFKEFKPLEGLTIWTPISEITQLTEFDDMQALQKAYAPEE